MKSLAHILAIAALLLNASLVGAADGGPVFHDNLDKAAAEAKASGKPLIAIFSASWCPPCQQMKKSVYPSKQARPFHDSFVWAYLDADDRANRPAMGRFGVSGIPHVAFVEPDGRILGHFAGAVAPEDFAEILSQVLKDSEKRSDGRPKSAPSGGSGTKR